MIPPIKDLGNPSMPLGASSSWMMFLKTAPQEKNRGDFISDKILPDDIFLSILKNNKQYIYLLVNLANNTNLITILVMPFTPKTKRNKGIMRKIRLGLTLSEIGKIYGISKQAVFHIKKRLSTSAFASTLGKSKICSRSLIKNKNL